MLPKSYDIIGNIAILKFPDNTKKTAKVKAAKALLKERKSLKTILEKKDKVKGRLRTIKTLYLAGEKTLIANYVENGCYFTLNVETCYFSPRLSNERKIIASQIKKDERVLVMFAGVGPFSVIIAKKTKAKEVYSLELGKECSKYAEINAKKNKLKNIHIVQGDVKKNKLKGKFDRIVMARPQLKDSFLKYAFKLIKKGGIINYYGFTKTKEEILTTIKTDAIKNKKQIKILRTKKAGEIAPYKFRFRVDFKVIN